MTRKHFIALADVLISQINDGCYVNNEIESVLHDWTVFCATQNDKFNQIFFRDYIDKRTTIKW